MILNQILMSFHFIFFIFFRFSSFSTCWFFSLFLIFLLRYSLLIEDPWSSKKVAFLSYESSNHQIFVFDIRFHVTVFFLSVSFLSNTLFIIINLFLCRFFFFFFFPSDIKLNFIMYLLLQLQLMIFLFFYLTHIFLHAAVDTFYIPESLSVTFSNDNFVLPLLRYLLVITLTSYHYSLTSSLRHTDIIIQ